MRAIVAHPVQNARIRTRRGDRGVADVVAFHARAQAEHAFHDAFGNRSRQRAHDVVEAALRRRDRRAQFRNFEVVFDQPHLRERGHEQRVVIEARDRDGFGAGGEAAHDAHGLVECRDVDERREFLDRLGLDAEARGGCGDAEPRADPEFALRAIGEERRVRLAGIGLGEHDRAVAVAFGHEHEHAVGLVNAGEIIEIGAGPEAVVRVVGADFFMTRRDHEHIARELRGDRAAARCEALATGQRRDGAGRRRPRLRHERQEIGGDPAIVRGRFGRIDHLHAAALLREKTHDPARAASAYKRDARETAGRA